ncbi:MAG: hypothetical protein NTW32_21000 [Chloroflexi bacterium]|nr:hypothetical protein [Chloroflexota bacterium]
MLKSWECAAFPEGIPKDLIYSDKIHNAPYPGDHGITFEQNPKKSFFNIEEFAENMKGEYPK